MRRKTYPAGQGHFRQLGRFQQLVQRATDMRALSFTPAVMMRDRWRAAAAVSQEDRLAEGFTGWGPRRDSSQTPGRGPAAHSHLTGDTLLPLPWGTGGPEGTFLRGHPRSPEPNLNYRPC